ncbi:energy transducer TonB, partial [Sinomicrobium sp. FJxs]|nr:energy transducer TonB [Sinomicrobium weinanense]
VATGLGLSGVQGIYVAFKVGADGEVSVIRIKAPHKKLEEEAKRVIGHIPKMRPGRQGNTPVDVMYSKAIIIKIE